MLNYEKILKRRCLFNSSWSIVGRLPTLSKDDDFRFSIVNDKVFQAMMNNESRKVFPCMLFSLVLDVPLDELLERAEFYKNHIDKGSLGEKQSIADCMLLYKNTILSLEMNGKNTLARNHNYVEKAASIRNREGQEYKFFNFVQINLNNFSVQGHDSIFEIYKTVDDEENLYGYQIFVNVFLLNLRKKYYNKGVESLTELERYIMGLVETSKEKAKYLIERSEILMEFEKEHERLFIVDLPDPIDKEAEERDICRMEGLEQGLERGRKEGRLEGRKEGRLEGELRGEARAYEAVARHLLSRGMTLDMIADYMDMPLSKVKSFSISEK